MTPCNVHNNKKKQQIWFGNLYDSFLFFSSKQKEVLQSTIFDNDNDSVDEENAHNYDHDDYQFICDNDF